MAIQATLNIIFVSFTHLSTSKFSQGLVLSVYSAASTDFATRKNGQVVKLPG
jgi:hypothetical protein